MQKESLLFFSFPRARIRNMFRLACPRTSAKPKLRKNERNAKGKLAFLFISEWQSYFDLQLPQRGKMRRKGNHKTHIFYFKSQNFSQKILFTATKHSRSKNGRFDPSACPRPMKNRGAKGENLHITPTSVHVFRFYFATFRVSVSTPKNKKSTPNFSAALTF